MYAMPLAWSELPTDFTRFMVHSHSASSGLQYSSIKEVFRVAVYTLKPNTRVRKQTLQTHCSSCGPKSPVVSPRGFNVVTLLTLVEPPVTLNFN